VREALMDKRTYTIYPLSRWIVCAVSNFIYTGRFFLEEEGDLFFFNEKGSKGKTGTFTRYVDFFKKFKVNF
jgi:hypothetical protein